MARPRRVDRRFLRALAVIAMLASACGSGHGQARVVGTDPVRRATSAPASTPARTSVASGAPGTSNGAPTVATVPPGTAKPGTPPTAPDVVPGSLAWDRCGDRVECASLTVPKDYGDVSKGTIDLFVMRRRAGKPSARVGSLLVNPGGPGVPGSVLAQDAPSYFSPTLLDRFDIVGWDPRGTGRSAPIVCRPNMDALLALDPTPDDAAEEQALVDGAKSVADDCQRSAGDLLPYVSTESTARDLEQIRKALGDEKLNYLGFSYGTLIGAYYATLFPASVRAMVLDGAYDPNAGVVALARAQAIGIERALTAALTACAKSSKCRFNHKGDPFTAFDTLMASLDVTPLVAKGASGAPPIGQGIAYLAVASTLYSQSYWNDLYNALADAERGNGRRLWDLYVSYTTYQGLAPHEYDAQLAVDCIDDPGPSDPSEWRKLRAEFAALAPRLGALAAVNSCLSWPVKAPSLTVTGAGAPPILVVGTTGDPVTPIEASAAMAKTLEHGVLLTVEANTHTGYNTNDCSMKTVDTYLIDLIVPAAGTVCS